MPRFRKKPVIIIEAVQWTGDNWQEVSDFFAETLSRTTRAPMDWPSPDGTTGKTLTVPTLEGDHTAQPGDWIIRGVKGEFYPCKPDIFAMTYKAVP